jgi:hypothetical protein
MTPLIPIIAFSDIQGCGGSSAWNPACGEDGGGNIDADPRFIDAEHGNLRLGSNSPAIDAGDNSAVPVGILTDLDGNPRFVDISDIIDTGSGTPPIIDMGAYEAQAFNLNINIIGSGQVSKTPNLPTYNYTEQVILTATAEPGWTFSGWSGDASGTVSPLTYSIYGASNITATFITSGSKIYLPLITR